MASANAPKLLGVMNVNLANTLVSDFHMPFRTAHRIAGDVALRRFHIKAMVATRSERGLSLIKPRSAVHIPTKAQEVFDVSGAGDTVIAV